MPRKSVPGKYYPPNWATISQIVKDAAEWKCVRCGHPDDRDVGRMLTVPIWIWTPPTAPGTTSRPCARSAT